MALAPGTRLGPYEILAFLGAGGMGEVYRARDTRLGRLVAVKVISSSALDEADGHRRLLREAQAASALNHPNIVAIHDVGTEQGAEFVAMELVDGQSLSEKLARGRLPLSDALKYAIQIAAAISAAHAAAIVHRDLKPQNVMVTADGAIKILDFGIAKTLGPHSGETATLARTGEGRIIGTVGYMSPEQAEGRPLDARSDIFSFGSVLYEMVGGEQPFKRDTALATLAAIGRDEPRPLSAMVPTAPAELERIITRCLRKDPARRFQSMADVRVLLEDLRDDLTAGRLERSKPAGDATQRPSRPGFGWLSAAIVGGMAIGALASGVMSNQRREQTVAQFLPTDLTRLTYDDGYTEGPALSPDGTLVAYASDRSGGDNLDIWVQRAAGDGDPIQLTRGDADERQPSFSPDGGHILFRSEAGGGALYSMPALGGEPRLVVDGGIGGQYSPDGQSIAYWTGGQIGFSQRANTYRTFIIPATGGVPSELRGFTGVRFPIWSPDGRFLLVAASRAEEPRAETYDWWIVRVADGHAVATGSYAAFSAAGVEALATTGAAVGLIPGAWIGDRIVAAGAGNLWSATLGPSPTYSIADVQRLTFGPGEANDPTVSRDGMVAFVGASARHNIWDLPIDAETATVRGDLRQVTQTGGHYSRATFSADGRLLAFQAQRGSRWTIMVMDISTGRVIDLAVRARPGGPVISPDGTKVAYGAVDGGAYIVETRGGASRKLCDRCGIGDWTSDGRRILAGRATLVDVGSGETVPLLNDAARVDRLHLNPDGSWFAFRVVEGERQKVFVAPLRPRSPPSESEWVAITDAETDVRPCGWSPSGRMLYLVSSRDGFRCLYACPWDSQKGRPRGPVQLVRHVHNVRNFGGGGTSVISTGVGNAVMNDRILLDLATTVSNIWTMRLPAAR